MYIKKYKMTKQQPNIILSLSGIGYIDKTSPWCSIIYHISRFFLIVSNIVFRGLLLPPVIWLLSIWSTLLPREYTCLFSICSDHLSRVLAIFASTILSSITAYPTQYSHLLNAYFNLMLILYWKWTLLFIISDQLAIDWVIFLKKPNQNIHKRKKVALEHMQYRRWATNNFDSNKNELCGWSQVWSVVGAC